MRKSIILLSLLLTAGALSGCISDDADPDPVDTTTSEPDGQTGQTNNTTTKQPADNVPPVPTLNVTNVSGEVPITVTFTLDGSDSDGLFFQWTLDANGDGTDDAEGEELPAKVNFTFDKADNYTAVFNLTDGEDFAEATLDLAFTAKAVPPVPEPIVFEGEISGITVVGDELGGPVLLKFNHTVPVTAVNISMEMSDESVDIDWFLFDPSGAEVDKSASGNTPFLDPSEDNLTIPEDSLHVFGEYTIELDPWFVPTASYKVTVEFIR